MEVVTNVPVPEHALRQDGYLEEFLVPMRPILTGDDDDVINGVKPRETINPCVMCFGHSKMDSCTKYSTPTERMHRIRDINFTLYSLGLVQMCPTCLRRSVFKVLSLTI